MNKHLQLWILLIAIVGLGVISTFAQDSTCPDAPEPRLEIGIDGEVTPGSANNVRNEPTTSADVLFRMEAGSRFIVLEGPVCRDGYNWWRIVKDGQEGWTVEGNNDGYFLAPIAPDAATATPVATSPATDECSLAPRLVVGEWGRTTSSTPSRLRDAAGVNGVRIGQIEPLETFRILEGPVCLDGINWWRVMVNYTAVEGWTAEGADGEYFLELVPIEPTPTPPFLSLPDAIDIAWSSDGAYIAVGTVEGVFLFDTTATQSLPTQILPEYRVNSLAFNPTVPNQLAVNASGNDEVLLQIVDVPTGEVVQVLSNHIMGYNIDLTFTDDGTKLGVNAFGEFTLYDVQTGESIYEVRPAFYGDGSLEFRGFATTTLSPDGEWLAGEYPGGQATFVFAGTIGSVQHELIGIETVSIEEVVTSIAYNPDSDRFVIGGENGNLRMWTVPDFEYASFIRGERSTTSNRVNAIAFSPTEPILVTAESDPKAVVRVFDAQTLAQHEAAVLEDTVGGAEDLAFNPDGTQLAVLVDDTVIILDTATLEPIERLVLQHN